MSANTQSSSRTKSALGEKILVRHSSRGKFQPGGMTQINILSLPRRTNSVKLVEKLIKYLYPNHLVSGNDIRFQSKHGYDQVFNQGMDGTQYGNNNFTIFCKKTNSDFEFTVVSHEFKQRLHF